MDTINRYCTKCHIEQKHSIGISRIGNPKFRCNVCGRIFIGKKESNSGDKAISLNHLKLKNY